MSRNLLDDFDRVFDLGVDVDAGLNRGISALPELLTSQAIQLLECVGRQRRGACRLLFLPAPRYCRLLGFLPRCDGCSFLVFFSWINFKKSAFRKQFLSNS